MPLKVGAPSKSHYLYQVASELVKNISHGRSAHPASRHFAPGKRDVLQGRPLEWFPCLPSCGSVGAGTWGEALPQSGAGGQRGSVGTDPLCCCCHLCLVAPALSSAGRPPEAASPPVEMGFTDSSGLKLKPQRTGLDQRIAVLSAGDVKYVITDSEGEVTDKRYGTVMVSHTHFLCVLLWVLYFILTL